MSGNPAKLGPGTIVAGKYRLVRVLGRGGMGTVIEARHVQLGTSFALKFLHRSILGTETVAERFLREARATAALRSEHVCRVFDVGEYVGAPYLVMELLDGIDLEKVLRRDGKIRPEQACGYVIQACAGVWEAHAAQIVHRDLKPGNLFLMTRSDGTPLIKVLDFGIAKAPQETELGLTGTDTVLGSPAYMSLEQLRSSKLVDTRSDIWSLGVILFELVSGKRPFTGEGVADLALRIAMEPMPHLFEGPAELDAIITRCLDRDPAKRYQDVGELARALAPFADEPDRRLAWSLGRASRSSEPSIIITTNAPERPAASPAAFSATQEAIPEAATTMQSVGVIENPKPARRGRPKLRAALLALSIAGGISLGLAARRGGDAGRAEAAEPTATAMLPSPAPVPATAPAPEPVPAPAAPAVAPAQPPATPVPPDASEDRTQAPPITLRFQIEPAGAAIELDGVFVTARQIKVHKDEVPHKLRITAPGYAPHTAEVHFDASQKLSVQLKRVAGARPARPTGAGSGRIESKSPYE